MYQNHETTLNLYVHIETNYIITLEENIHNSHLPFKNDSVTNIIFSKYLNTTILAWGVDMLFSLRKFKSYVLSISCYISVQYNYHIIDLFSL